MTDIQIDGESIEGFNSDILTYTSRKSPSAGIPQVTATAASDDVTITVQQAEAVPGQAVVTATSASGFQRVYTVDFIFNEYVYLSDLEETSETVGYGTFTKDANLSGDKISVYQDGSKVTYDKGITAHAASEVVYDLTGLDAERFQAWVGICLLYTSHHPDRDGRGPAGSPGGRRCRRGGLCGSGAAGHRQPVPQ